MLADDQADDHQRNGDADRERRLAPVDAAFGRALVFRQLDRQRRDLGLGDDQRQQVLAPRQNENEQEGGNQAGAYQRQHDLEDGAPPRGAENFGGLLDLAWNLIDEALRHPYGVRQRREEIDQDQPGHRIEQAEGGIVERQRRHDHDRRDHAQHQQLEHARLGQDAIARDPVGHHRPEQYRQERRGAGDDGRVHERDERLLRGDRVLGGGIFLGTEPDVEVVRQRRRMREIDRRPGEPLRVRLERGRDHPEDREGRDNGPPREQDVTHDRGYSTSPGLPHQPAAFCPAYMASSDCFSRRRSLIANRTITIISSMTR